MKEGCIEEVILTETRQFPCKDSISATCAWNWYALAAASAGGDGEYPTTVADQGFRQYTEAALFVSLGRGEESVDGRAVGTPSAYISRMLRVEVGIVEDPGAFVVGFVVGILGNRDKEWRGRRTGKELSPHLSDKAIFLNAAGTTEWNA